MLLFSVWKAATGGGGGGSGYLASTPKDICVVVLCVCRDLFYERKIATQQQQDAQLYPKCAGRHCVRFNEGIFHCLSSAEVNNKR